MKKLYLSRKDRKIFGVCGGIGEACGVDPTLVRLACVFFCLLSMIVPMTVTYIVAWMVVPEPPETEQ